MMRKDIGRPTWVEIDLAALRWNAKQVRQLVGKQVRILAVVKANAYGHGAVACAKALVASGAEELGVASLEEAEELRRQGVKQPITIFGLIQSYEAQHALELDVQPTVVQTGQSQALVKAARKNKKKVRLQLKVDTGMGRIGLPPEEAVAFLDNIKKKSELTLRGIFTHFAHADGRDRKLLQEQMQRLQHVVKHASSLGFQDFVVHAANSAAVIDAPDTHLDMVRPGLMLYGLCPAARLKKKVSLRPVLSWKTRIIQIKQVPAGVGLSYGHTYTTRRNARIATVPVGYADGFSRAFSNRGKVIIRGTLCPIVGRVCMDLSLVDVTAVKGTAVGDEVTIIGNQGQIYRTADDLAKDLNTISYEVVCAIGSRVPRLYQGEHI